MARCISSTRQASRRFKSSMQNQTVGIDINNSLTNTIGTGLGTKPDVRVRDHPKELAGTIPKTGGHQPNTTGGSNPKTGGHQPYKTGNSAQRHQPKNWRAQTQRSTRDTTPVRGAHCLQGCTRNQPKLVLFHKWFRARQEAARGPVSVLLRGPNTEAECLVCVPASDCVWPR